jgi:hypothetical protein
VLYLHSLKVQTMDVLCAGMFRSGSTWQYNIACELLERVDSGQRLGFVEGWEYEQATSGEATPVRVLKTHDAHFRFADSLMAGKARAIYSFRDLRDVAYSLMHKFKVSFEEVISADGLLRKCTRNDAFWTDLPNVLTQRYENLIQNADAMVRQIARFLGLETDHDMARLLAEAYSLPHNVARADELARELREQGIDLDDKANALACDAHTLLHWNHCRTGRVGAWKEVATAEQRLLLGEVCGDWLIRRGYETDMNWASV